MHWYWRYKRLFAIYIELSKAIGMRPFLKIRRIQNELMIEISYGYVIITPRQILLNEHLAHKNRRAHGMSNHEKRDRRILNAPARATKNRP